MDTALLDTIDEGEKRKKTVELSTTHFFVTRFIHDSVAKTSDSFVIPILWP